jgi:hypothetical protein
VGAGGHADKESESESSGIEGEEQEATTSLQMSLQENPLKQKKFFQWNAHYWDFYDHKASWPKQEFIPRAQFKQWKQEWAEENEKKKREHGFAQLGEEASTRRKAWAMHLFSKMQNNV